MGNRESRVFGVILITSICFLSCKVQTIYGLSSLPEDRVANNYYVKDLNNDHDAIVGVWKWQTLSQSFEITLQEFEMNKYPTYSNESWDEVYGKYTYISDGNVISETTTINPLPDAKLSLHFRSPTEYEVVIKDVVSSLTYNGKFILTSPNTATLELKPSPGLKISPTGTAPNFTLPTSAVLTKQ